MNLKELKALVVRRAKCGSEEEFADCSVDHAFFLIELNHLTTANPERWRDVDERTIVSKEDIRRALAGFKKLPQKDEVGKTHTPRA